MDKTSLHMLTHLRSLCEIHVKEIFNEVYGNQYIRQGSSNYESNRQGGKKGGEGKEYLKYRSRENTHWDKRAGEGRGGSGREEAETG